MKAKGPKENFRVVVEPRRLGDFGSVSMGVGLLYGRGPDAVLRAERDMQERCEEIADQIKRHADNVAYVSIECDQGEICQHCGAQWTESTPHNGGCCDADVTEMDAYEAAK